MKKQISITLAAGLLIAGVSAASATEMSQSLATKMSPQSTKTQHNVYAGHRNKGQQQHATFTVSRPATHNADID
jgi:hypothetical protein